MPYGNLVKYIDFGGTGKQRYNYLTEFKESFIRGRL
jgi:hypothetical protein